MTWLDEIKDGPLYWEHAVPNDEEPFRALSQERVEWLVAIAEAVYEWSAADSARTKAIREHSSERVRIAGAARRESERRLRCLLEQQP